MKLGNTEICMASKILTDGEDCPLFGIEVRC